jgi:hydrogenase maturation factor
VSGNCDDGHCVTCSDEGVAMRVIAVRADGTAICDGDVEVMTDLIGDVAAGEEVLVHAGVALVRLE